MMDFF